MRFAPPQGASGKDAAFLHDPFLEKAIPKSPQAFRNCKNKNNYSSEYAQSEAETIQIVSQLT